MDITSQINKWAKLVNESSDNLDIDESENFQKARKIGYLGDDNEEKVAEWLKSEYAKWKLHTLEVFTRVSDGDEEKGQQLFNKFNWIGMLNGFSSAWSSEEKKFMKPEEHLAKFAEKVPVDDPEIKELFAKLERKWKADNKGVADYYATSSSRGGWTGD